MAPSVIRPLSTLVDAFLLISIFCCVPFAWILRDGLGPDSISISGFPAVKAAFMTFYAGPAILLFVGFQFLLRHITKSTEGEDSNSEESSYWVWRILLFAFLTLLASGLLSD